MMVVEWIPKQSGDAWALGFQIKNPNQQLDNVCNLCIHKENSTIILSHSCCFNGLSDGNGFKTSSMRLGADAIVFSRHADDRYKCDSVVFYRLAHLILNVYNCHAKQVKWLSWVAIRYIWSYGKHTSSITLKFVY
jgi:hypothetical protein